MNNLEISKEGLKRAEQWFQNGSRAMEDERWNDVVFSHEMAVEQALKAILILYGMEYPKIHNITKFYVNTDKTNIPKWFADNMGFHAKILKDLIKLRNNAAYDYSQGLTKDDFKDDAINFKDAVIKILDDCKKLIQNFDNKAVQ